MVLSVCGILFSAVVGLSLFGGGRASANHQCCDPETCLLVTSPASIVVNGSAFSFVVIFEHCTPDEPFIGAVDLSEASQTNVVESSIMYSPAYFFPDGCHGVTFVDVGGSKEGPGSAQVISHSFVWDSGGVFCEDDETTNIP
jgi:hypothetical protein